MSTFKAFVHNLIGKLFERKPQETVEEPEAQSEDNDVSSSEPIVYTSLSQPRRDPYFIQIGYDFGTSFSKCVCRDLIVNKAWVHIPSASENQELPFLIPSVIILKDGRLSHVEHVGIHYPENGFFHLKTALAAVALERWNIPVLESYLRAVWHANPNQLPGFVESCAIYFLAGVFGEIRQAIRRKFTDFGTMPEDYMAINLAVPVAEAELPQVNALFHRVLCEAWGLADQLAMHPPIHIEELQLLRAATHSHLNKSISEACFVYPEVSANVQGFVRSRVSSPGLYLFSDTGAGTVDQSVFIFQRMDDQSEYLAYLHAAVLPLGSSHIEHRAAEKAGDTGRTSLEMWRKRKEDGGTEVELFKAREWVADHLGKETTKTLACAQQKLYYKDDINEIRVIFGGGGHCKDPYKMAVMHPFSDSLSASIFRQTAKPDIVGLPLPRDIEINGSETRWMRRLSVAYGLSFERSELAGFKYPSDVSTPEPQQIWPRRKQDI